MGNSKKSINIKIAANTESAAKGIEQITRKLNEFEKQSKNSLSKVSRFASAVNGLQAATSLVTSGIKNAVSAISECSDAYERQADAETLLAAAVKNNPYMNEQSVLQLKEYASHLQSISTVGDEELLPFMAQLAASGRTQTEIQQIMGAALDVSASGAMSLESAVKNLNKTFSGLSGELGESVPQIKQLTAEQLKNGDAVKILAEQYSGMAKSTAGSTGGWKQFRNTLGDLQEMIGEKFSEKKNAAGQVLNSFFSKVVEKLQAAKKETDEFRAKLGLIAQNDGADATISSYQSELDLLKQENAEIQKKRDVLSSKSWKQYAAAQTAALKQEVEAYESKAAELSKATTDAYNAWLPYSQAVTDAEKTKQAELWKTYQTALKTEQEYLKEQQGVKKRLKETTKAMKEEYNDLIADQETWTAESLKKDEDANRKRIEFLERQIAIKKEAEEN